MAVENGVSGYVDTSLERLISRMRHLLANPAEARRLGEGARRRALQRFQIDRFIRDWDQTFHSVVAANLAIRARASDGLLGERTV
jgi:hypothetical protein